MSNLTEIGLVVALAGFNMLVYLRMDRALSEQYAWITTGVMSGGSISTTARWLLLRSYWTATTVMVVFFQGLMGIGWLLIAANMTAEGARVFPYMAAFFTFVSAFSRLVIGPFWYSHQVSILRQAEAD
jgi:hypothetical protein